VLCRGRRGGRARGRRLQGRRQGRLRGKPILESAWVMARSQTQARPQPPPIAAPLMRPTTTMGSVRSLTQNSASELSRMPGAFSSPRTALRSMPAQKDLPAPVKMRTEMSVRAASSSARSWSAWRRSIESALRESGRLIVRVAMRAEDSSVARVMVGVRRERRDAEDAEGRGEEGRGRHQGNEAARQGEK
jgi:hypothetical protein